MDSLLLPFFIARGTGVGLIDNAVHGKQRGSVSARRRDGTLLAQAGVPRGIIATIVGHDDPAFTERVYTHIDLESVRQTTTALESIFVK